MELARDHMDRLRIRHAFRGWRGYRGIVESRKQIRQEKLERSRIAREKTWLHAWERVAARIAKLRQMSRLAAELATKSRLARGLYSWRSYVEYKSAMKHRVQMLMKTGNAAGAVGTVDKFRIEQVYRAKFLALRRGIMKLPMPSEKVGIEQVVRPEKEGMSAEEEERPRRLSPEQLYIKPTSFASQASGEAGTAAVMTTVRTPFVLPAAFFSNQVKQREERLEAARTRRLFPAEASTPAQTVTGGRRAPNQLYKMLEDKLYKDSVPSSSFFARQAKAGEPVEVSTRLKEHAQQALSSLRVLLRLPLKYHRSAAAMSGGARRNPTSSVKDMLQSSVNYKRMSIYFTQWKVGFLSKWVVSDCQLVRIYRFARGFFSQLRTYCSETREVGMRKRRREGISR